MISADFSYVREANNDESYIESYALEDDTYLKLYFDSLVEKHNILREGEV
jgi:hypothetical protein